MREIVVKPGDVIGFSGGGALSTAIKLGSLANPWSGISHVGVVAQARGYGDLVFESTSLEDLPCAIRGTRLAGVQAHSLVDLLGTYDGWVYHYPLYRQLYRHESSRLTAYLLELIGTRYDESGAVRSGGLVYSAINAMKYGQNLSSIFCSELVASAFANIGIWATDNASRWNPAMLIRSLRGSGIIGKPERLK